MSKKLANTFMKKPLIEGSIFEDGYSLNDDNDALTVTDENGNVYYHVVWGDTLCSISSDLHISVDELAEYNHIRNVHLIYAESDLRIPPESYDPNATEVPRDDASNSASTSSSN